MYRPKQLGILRAHRGAILYREFAATSPRLVSCFWELRTTKPLASDFQYLVLPDGCVDMVFDVSARPDFDGSLVMTPSTEAVTLNLGKQFAYVGIRLQPGVWTEELTAIVGGSMQLDKLAGNDLRQIRSRLAAKGDFRRILDGLVDTMERQGLVGENYVVQAILQRPADTVQDCAINLGFSRRQTQRILHQRLGFAPHDFLRILRFQHSISGSGADNYADQSHYIREFKRITGMTPGAFQASYS